MTDTSDARGRVYRCCGPAGNRPSAARAHQLVHAAHLQVTQTIKRTNHTYFVLDDYICALRTAKDTSTSSSTTRAPLGPRGDHQRWP